MRVVELERIANLFLDDWGLVVSGDEQRDRRLNRRLLDRPREEALQGPKQHGVSHVRIDNERQRNPEDELDCHGLDRFRLHTVELAVDF